jgi:hypothetical protein
MADERIIRLKKWIDLGQYQILGMTPYGQIWERTRDEVIADLKEYERNFREPAKIILQVPPEDEKAIKEALKGNKKYTLA